MPSRPLTQPSPDPHRRRDILLAIIVASFSALLLAVLAFLLLLFCLYRSLRRARARDPTLPLDAPFASSLRRFSFRDRLLRPLPLPRPLRLRRHLSWHPPRRQVCRRQTPRPPLLLLPLVLPSPNLLRPRVPQRAPCPRRPPPFPLRHLPPRVLPRQPPPPPPRLRVHAQRQPPRRPLLLLRSSSRPQLGSPVRHRPRRRPSPRLPQLGSPVREWIGSQIGPSSNPDWDNVRKNSPKNCFNSRNLSQTGRLDGGEDAFFQKSGLDASVGKPEKK